MNRFTNGYVVQGDVGTRLRRVVAPSEEPITLDEAKTHLRVTLANHDAYITSLIVAARETCEATINRSFLNTIWEYVLDDFPVAPLGPSRIKLPVASVLNILSVEYLDVAGVRRSLVQGVDFQAVNGAPGFVATAPGTLWPTIQMDAVESIVVRFAAGYGALPEDVPAAVKHAMLLLVGDWYRNREQTIVGTISSDLPTGVQRLLDTQRWGDYW